MRVIWYTAMSMDGRIADAEDSLGFLGLIGEREQDWREEFHEFIAGIDAVLLGAGTLRWLLANGHGWPHGDLPTWLVSHDQDLVVQVGDTEQPFRYQVAPREQANRYAGPVAVLIGPKVASSCESFVLMMQQGSRCKLVGSATKGSSGRPQPCELGNGVTVYLSSWEDQLPDGTVLEGHGVKPDVAVQTNLEDLRQTDAVLDAAIDFVREKAPALRS